MAKHSPPEDNSFTLSLVRHLGAAVALVAVCAAAFWGIGQVRDDSPTTEIASAPGDADDEMTASPEAPATPDTSTDPASDPASATPPADDGTTSEAPTTEPEDAGTDEPVAEPTADEATTDGGDADPADISVQILDATGADDGETATRVADQLREDGFNLVATNKAIRVYETTTVFYTPGNEAKAQQIAAEYGYREVAPEPGNLSHSVDVHLVVGTDA